MGELLSFIDFILGNNKFGMLLSITVILIVAAFFVLIHEYKKQVFYYVFHRRNRGHVTSFLLYTASILILARYSTLPVGYLQILFVLNAIYCVLCIIGIKKPLGLAGIKLKQYQQRIDAGLAQESKEFFESNHWYLIDSIDKVRFAQLQSKYYAAVGKNIRGFTALRPYQISFFIKRNRKTFLKKKLDFFIKWAILLPLRK